MQVVIFRREWFREWKWLSLLLLPSLLFCLQASSQTYNVGQSYYGRSNYIQYIAGDMPLIFSAPHGGLLLPGELPGRTCSGISDCTTTTDSNTPDVAQALQTICRNMFGHYPHIVICWLDRDKIDCNRNLVEGTYTSAGIPSSLTEISWNDWTGFMVAASNSVATRTGRGFYIDLHGQGHPIQRLELGYLLDKYDLTNTDAALNSNFYINQSSIRTLAHQVSIPFSQLLRGSNSFGSFMAAKGFPCTPSPSDPSPGVANSFFNGGYNTATYGSDNGGPIDALQIEANYTGVRDTSANRTNYATAIAQTLDFFFTNYYGIDLRLTAPCIWNVGSGNWGTAGNWGGTLPVSGNYLLFTGSGGTASHNLSALTGSGRVHAIFFDTNAGSYTLSGNAINLVTGLINNASSPQTVNNNLALPGDASFLANSNSINIGGVISGTGSLTKGGSGTLSFTTVHTYTGPTTNKAGVISLNATATLGTGTNVLVLAGGSILCNNTRSVSPLTNPVLLTADSAIFGDSTQTNSTRILPFGANSITGTAGTLTIHNACTNANAYSNIFKVRFLGGGFNFSRPIVVGTSNDLPNTISQLESYNDLVSGDETFSGVISGNGQVRRDAASTGTAGRTLLTGANTYTGGTVVNTGTLLINNTTGSGSGTGPVTVNPDGTLGGNGTVAGAATIAGALSPGSSVGQLTFDGGLNISAGTCIWELAALSTNNPGTDFDSVLIRGGNLSLGVSSTLSLAFTGTASAPAPGIPFWQAAHSWKVVSLGGTATNTGPTKFSALQNATFSTGSLSNYVDAAGSIVLQYTPAPAPAPTVNVHSALNGGSTLSWDTINGRNYTVQYKDDLAAVSWSTLTSLVASASSVTILDINGPAQRFYRVIAQ